MIASTKRREMPLCFRLADVTNVAHRYAYIHSSSLCNQLQLRLTSGELCAVMEANCEQLKLFEGTFDGAGS